MKTVRPRPMPLPPGLALTPEEGFVLSRIDGTLSVGELVALTGIEAGRVEGIVTKLEACGAVTLDLAPVPVPVPVPDPTPDEDDEDETPDTGADEATHRALYEAKVRGMPSDARAALARTATGDLLVALAFDPEPVVIAALFENPTASAVHARVVAAHHPTATGLEILTRDVRRLRDGLVERRLLRNPASGEMVLGRVLGPKRLAAVHKIATDRDVPELTRVRARAALRQRWQSAAPEDRADLLLRTEARCLTVMTGCTFDAKTTQILCSKTSLSSLFVQNVAKFGAAPPALLAHFAKQPYVTRSIPLKRLLLQHPNLPGDVKRSL